MKRFLIVLVSLSLTGLLFPLYSQINTDRVFANGRNALYFEDYILSIQYFNQVIRAKPYLPEPYLYRAMAKFNLDDYKGAENDATLCIERNPFLYQAYQCRGAARQNLGDYVGAEQDYSKGLDLKPEDRQLLTNRGIALLQGKNLDEAEKNFNNLIRIQPKYPQAYLLRGSMFAEKGDTAKAYEDFSKAIALDKYFAPSYGQRGLLYLQQKDYKDALSDFDQAIRLDGSNVGYYINRGLVRYYQNDLRGAMADYDAVVGIDSRNIVARFNRGLLRAQVGDDNRAIEDFNIVIEQEADNFMAIYNRAILREQTGDYRGAITDINLVLKEYPNFIPGYYYRSELKRRINDVKGADSDHWYAYDLEQQLRAERNKGKVVTGKAVLSASEAEDMADNPGAGDKTREKSDKDIAKFNRLVVYDKDEQQDSRYEGGLRGRVQDNQVRVDLKPQFVITYYERNEGLRTLSRSDRMVSDYNQRRLLKLDLKITNQEAALTDDQAEFHFKSINDYSLAIAGNENDLNAYFGRAIDFMVLQDLTEAMKDLNRIIELNPKFAMAYFNRAVVRYKLTELEKYNTDNQENNELTLNIQNLKKKSAPGAQYPTAPVLENKTDNKRIYDQELIVRDYDEVLKINPDFVYAYFNRANIRGAQKDFRAALHDYNEAIQRDPDFAEAYFNRGLTRLYLGDTQRGIEDLSKAGELGIVDAYSIIKRMTE